MEAESARNRINDLKKQLFNKRRKEMQQGHEVQKNEVEKVFYMQFHHFLKAYQEEFNQFNAFWDQKMLNFEEEAKKVEQELMTRQD